MHRIKFKYSSILMKTSENNKNRSQINGSVPTRALISQLLIARSAGVHYTHCVSPSVCPWSVSENAHNSCTTGYILIKF